MYLDIKTKNCNIKMSEKKFRNFFLFKRFALVFYFNYNFVKKKNFPSFKICEK